MSSNYIALHSTNNTTAGESNIQSNTIMESELQNQETLNQSNENDKGLLHNLWNNYTQNPFLLIELTLTFLYAGTSHFLLHWLFGMSTYERPIPYQETAEGDILLDLYVDRALVERETVPDWVLLVICYPISMVMVVIIAFSCGTESMRRRCELHSGICTLLFSLGSTSLITTFGKNYIGYLRPNFYEYCNYDADTMSCENQETNPRKSFPSGHASMSFGSMTVLTLILLGKISWNQSLVANSIQQQHHDMIQNSSSPSSQELTNNLMNAKKEMMKQCLKQKLVACVACLPILLALFVAFSRVHDDMHHPADIVAGSIIGICCASFAYALWYPPLSSPMSSIPHILFHELSINEQLTNQHDAPSPPTLS